MIKNVIFDVGNVLIDFCDRDYMAGLGFSEDAIDCLARKVVSNPLWNEYDRSALPRAEVEQMLKNQVPEYPKEADLFFEKIVDIVRNRPYAKEWVHELRSRDYEVYLLSNYPKEIWELHEREIFDFTEELSGKVVSGFVQLIKPEEAIYRVLLDNYHLKPQECVFLDDREENVDMAISLGMKGIVFHSYEQAKEELEKTLKEN
ncbi:MAG: HAD family hydrolase [Lachnospiraceae bacterium]